MGDCGDESCVCPLSSLEAGNVSGDGVIANAVAWRGYLHGNADLPDVGTYVSGGVDEGLNGDLPLEVVKGDDLIIRGAQDAVRPGQDLTVKNARLALGPDNPVGASQEERLETVEENSSITYVLNSDEPDGGIVASAVDSFQTFAGFLFCDQIFASVLQRCERLSEQSGEGDQADDQHDSRDDRFEQSKAVLRGLKAEIAAALGSYWFHVLTPPFDDRYQPLTRPVDPNSETALLE